MVNKDECMMEAIQPIIIWSMPKKKGYAPKLDPNAQNLLQAPVDEKEEKFGTAQEKGLKVQQEKVAPALRKKMTKVAAKTLISEGHDRAKFE